MVVCQLLHAAYPDAAGDSTGNPSTVYAAAQENAARREMNLSALFSALGELTLSEFMHVNGHEP